MVKNTIDYRKKDLFKGAIGIEDRPFIPKGVTNTLMDLVVAAPNGDIAIGDVEIGTDGFVEIMFMKNAAFFKIKRLPGDEKVYFGAYEEDRK